LNTSELLSKLRASVSEIADLRKIPEGYDHPHVKAWKTKLEALLVDGGTTCKNTLKNLKNIKSSFGGNSFIKVQTYMNQLDSLERTLKECIQTIEFLGRPEDKQDLPSWGKPKSQHKAIGRLLIGDEEVSTDTITIAEVLECLVSLSEDTNDLTPMLSKMLIEHLRAVLDDELLQPFLSHKIDSLLGHWPEFADKNKR
jgi:hypothetical protein